LRLDERTLERHSGLAGSDAVSQKDRDTAEAAAGIARAQLRMALARVEALTAMERTIEQRQAEIDLATANLAAADSDLADTKQRLRDTKIYSPIDGVVTQREVQTGQIIASGIVNIGGGTTLLTISDLSRIFVMAEVHESDIGRLVETGRLGQEAAVTVDAYPGKRFRGKVVQITPRGFSEAKVISFYVKVEVLGEEKRLLLPKMTADVRILADRREGVLLAPNQCIHYEVDRPYVEIRSLGDFERRWVKLGLNDGAQAEVLEGLKDGDEVAERAVASSRWLNLAGGTSKPASTSKP
jgi:RND family efflux transporter MFP subunit